MLKSELRALYKTKRKALTANDISEYSLAIANQSLRLPIWENTYYHLFLSITTLKEVQTEYLLQVLHAKDKEIVVSRSDFNTLEMTNFLLTDNTILKNNSYGIPEPLDGIEVPHKKIEVVFIPLLAFDDNGNRIGYGKGFYDNLLQKCNPNCIKIGLSFFESTAIISDVFKGDVPLDYCITPNKTYCFNPTH